MYGIHEMLETLRTVVDPYVTVSFSQQDKTDALRLQMTFDPLLPIGNDNENLDWTLSSSLQNVTVSDMEVMANAFTRS
jgi:hypothetical protein